MAQELKAYDFPVDHGDFTTTIELFYLKSEADKVIAELETYERDIKVQKYKWCLAMSECREAQSRWCYQAANTLPPGVTATLNGKPVMVEPRQLFIRSERLLLASGLWKRRSEKFKEAK